VLPHLVELGRGLAAVFEFPIFIFWGEGKREVRKRKGNPKGPDFASPSLSLPLSLSFPSVLPKRGQLPLGLPSLLVEPRQRRLQPQRVLGRDAQLALEPVARLERRCRLLVERAGLLVGILDLCFVFFGVFVGRLFSVLMLYCFLERGGKARDRNGERRKKERSARIFPERGAQPFSQIPATLATNCNTHSRMNTSKLLFLSSSRLFTLLHLGQALEVGPVPCLLRVELEELGRGVGFVG